jgi:hypothetical protein
LLKIEHDTKIKIQHYEVIDPKVQQKGDIAILTYNRVDDVVQLPDLPANITVPWNCTAVYARIEGQAPSPVREKTQRSSKSSFTMRSRAAGISLPSPAGETPAGSPYHGS